MDADGTDQPVSVDERVTAGTRALITWLRERPSQVWLVMKSCSMFVEPMVTATVLMTVPFRLAVIWYLPGARAI